MDLTVVVNMENLSYQRNFHWPCNIIYYYIYCYILLSSFFLSHFHSPFFSNKNIQRGNKLFLCSNFHLLLSYF